jgi:predicted flap endonuclease-1-like 5' DNA nuclease
MTMFIIQSALLLAIAFILGAMLGCLSHRLFGGTANKSAGLALAAAALGNVAAAARPAPRDAAALVAADARTTSLAEDAPSATLATPAIPAKPDAAATTKAPVSPVSGAKAEKPAKAEGKAAVKPARDDIKLIVGVGRTNEAALNAIGIYTFAEIAALTASQQKEIGEKLAFPGRIEREQWVKQARSLMEGKNPISKGAFKPGNKK